MSATSSAGPGLDMDTEPVPDAVARPEEARVNRAPNMQRGYAEMRAFARLLVVDYPQMYEELLEARAVCESVTAHLRGLGAFVSTGALEDVEEQAIFIEAFPHHSGPTLLQPTDRRAVWNATPERCTSIRAWLTKWQSVPSHLLEHYDVEMEQAGVPDTLDDKIRFWFYTLPRLHAGKASNVEELIQSPLSIRQRKAILARGGSGKESMVRLSENSELAYVRALCMYLGVKRNHHRCYIAIREALRAMLVKNNTFLEELRVVDRDIAADADALEGWHETLQQAPNYGHENDRYAEFEADPAATLVRFLRSTPGARYWRVFAQRKRITVTQSTLDELVADWGEQQSAQLESLQTQVVTDPHLMRQLLQWVRAGSVAIRKTLLSIGLDYENSFQRYDADRLLSVTYEEHALPSSMEHQLNTAMLVLHQMMTIMLVLFEFDIGPLDGDDDDASGSTSAKDRRGVIMDYIAGPSINAEANTLACIDTTCAVQLRYDTTAYSTERVSNPTLLRCREILDENLTTTMFALQERATTHAFLQRLLSNAVTAQLMINRKLLQTPVELWIAQRRAYHKIRTLELMDEYASADTAFSSQMIAALERALDETFPDPDDTE